MTHSNALRPLCLGTTLLFLAMAIVVGCGPNASPPPQPPVVDDTPPPAVKPDEEPAFTPEIEPDRETAADQPDATDQPDSEPEVVELEPIELKDVDELRADEPTVDEPSLEPTDVPFEQPKPEPVRDLGPPLVENFEQLKKLDPTKPVWLDAKNRRVVMVGQVCQREAGLELFACLKDTKEHESILTVDVKAATVHAGLLASGAMAGSPVRFNPMYMPAEGTEIEITLVWKNEEGKLATARAQDWILDAETDEPMAHPWVFAGSGFWVEEETGKKHYQAEGGDFICVSNFSTAMLDLPIESSQANSALMYQTLTSAIPPLGTPVTLILTPKTENSESEEKPTPEKKDSPKESGPDEIDQPAADPPVESDDEGAADNS